MTVAAMAAGVTGWLAVPALAEPSTASTSDKSKHPSPAIPELAPHHRPVPRAVTGGAVLFGVAYALVLYFPVREGFQGDSAWLAAPIAGPVLAARSGFAEVNYWGLALDEVGQLGGATLLTLGLAYGYRGVPAVAALHVTRQPSRATVQVVASW
jgi:hypothetical protein